MIAIKDMEMPEYCAKCFLLWEGKVTNRCRKNLKMLQIYLLDQIGVH